MYHIKNDKRSIQSYEWIYAALSRLINHQEFTKIKVTEIIKEAGVSRATFYRNFDSKDDVLRYECDKTFKDLLSYLIKYQKSTSIQHNSEFLKPFLYFFDSHTLIVEQLIKAGRQEMLSESLKMILENYQPQYKKLAEEPNKSWDYFIAIRCGITINILIQWIKNKKHLPPEELSNLIIGEMKKPFTIQQFI